MTISQFFLKIKLETGYQSITFCRKKHKSEGFFQEY